jgi:diguanylate cyclase (GGDEF)-like protein
MFPTQFLPAALDELKHAVDCHDLWTRQLSRTLACRLPPDPADLAPDAHLHCRFGRWYQGAEASLHEFPDFVAIDAPHRAMHRAAATLLRISGRGEALSPAGYDRFAAALDRMRRRLHALIRELESRLYDLDPLTGAETRTRMLPALRDLVEMSRRQGAECCLSIMDLDNFKQVNDLHGHLAGDRMLAAVVRALKGSLRRNDKVFRYGGEEFLISLPWTGIEMACAVLERARARLAAKALLEEQAPGLRLTASFGVAVLDPGASIEQSIEHADQALYDAKAGGRNRVMAWEPAPRTGWR